MEAGQRMLHCLLLTFILWDSVKAVDLNDVLIDNPACKDDARVLKEVCDKNLGELSNNLVVLYCIDTLPHTLELSAECNTAVWHYKMEVTKQDVFLNQSRSLCGGEVLAQCMDQKESGHLLACMVESRSKAKSLQCSQFLRHLEIRIYSDWRIISKFMTECESDVLKLNCGSVRPHLNKDEKEDHEQVHSQEHTLACLTQKISEVGPQCKKQILLLAELQADDFHLDRELYYACRGDRETLCPGIQAGEGRVYHCLTQNKLKASLPCQKQLTRRQVIAAQDYKADASLLVTCKEELQEFQCLANHEDEEAVKLSTVILCLEDNMRDGRQVGGPCVGEMRDIRRSLMEDLNITPELVTSCRHEIKDLCKNMDGDGKTIHCLMQAAMDQNLSKNQLLGPKCEKALNVVLREVQMAADWKADPVLEEACESVVVAKCDAKLGGDAVMSCLMRELAKDRENIRGEMSSELENRDSSSYMTKECSAVLMQIHYFLARDVLIDEHLYKACRSDAKEICGAGQGWHRTEEDSRHSLVFPCLVRNLYIQDPDDLEDGEDTEDGSKGGGAVLSGKCTQEVERTLQQRAMAVQLHPEVEEVCREDLHKRCGQYSGPGQEFECLQEKYSDLQVECQNIVGQYTRLEAKNPFLHPIVTKACSNLISRKCGAEAKAKDGAGVMECLIRHKLEHPQGSQGAMNNKCRVIVEHWQIITLKDWKFSPRFKEACKEDIREHCANPRPTKKAEVIGCLVMIISNDTVLEDKHRIKKSCRAELKLELLARHADLRLNPELEEACRLELETHCSEGDTQQEQDGGIECLKNIKPKEISSKKCKKLLFGEEEQEADDPEVDYALLRGCKREIKQHCSDESPENVLHCLKDYQGDTNFDAGCVAVIRRRTLQRMKDYRLNPELRKLCKQDIVQFCGKLLVGKDRAGAQLFQGHVIQCLKEVLVQKQSGLSRPCHTQVLGLMEEAAPLIEADAILEESCPNSISSCKLKPDVSSDLDIHECLKHMFESKQLEDGGACNRHIALIIEGASADIHVDPVLHSACSLDLKKFCRDIRQGQGKLLSCLVAASRETSFTLEPECGALLARRVHMYDMAIKVRPLHTAEQLYRSIMESHHRNYFLSFGFMFLGIIFMLGLCFGRVTHRLRNEIKNR